MNGLKLVVQHGHAHEWIQQGALVGKRLPVGQQLAQMVLALGRRVIDLAGMTVLELGAGRVPDVVVLARNRAANFGSEARRERTALDGVEPVPEPVPPVPEPVEGSGTYRSRTLPE